jgi:CHASE3 domain sensor protein
MSPDSARRFALPTAIVSLLLLGLLLAGGLLVRVSATQAISANERVRDARNLVSSALTIQLDEETGVRGYTSTHARLFLEPYDDSLGRLGPTLDQLAAASSDLGISDALPAIADARTRNEQWLREVAEPLLGIDPRANVFATQQKGKTLIDGFRADLGHVDDALRARERRLAADARTAINRINLLTTITAILVVFGGGLYAGVQIRSATRLSEEQQRGAALEAAYLAEKRIADTLQEGFTQRPLPALPTLRFSATYVPATELALVGGDWYDAIELPQNRVLFAIGDVTGHGIDAAVAMNRIRNALLSSVLLDPDPATVLTRLNRDALEQRSPIVSAVVGYADAQTYEFVYAIAGHPPPVLLEPGRPPRLLEFGSVPLGAVAVATYRTRRVQSVPGATLVLYTDGAVEHSHDVIEGERVLLEAVARAGQSAPSDPAAFIHNAIFSDRSRRDDVAILTVGFATSQASSINLSAEWSSDGFTGHITRAVDEPGPKARAA